MLNEEERCRVAYHEMGRALVAATLPSVDLVQKVSIVPCRVGALGYTIRHRQRMASSSAGQPRRSRS